MTILVVTELSIDKNELSALKAFGMEIMDWTTAYSVKPSDNEAVILDTRIQATTEEDIRPFSSLFESMRSEIETLLIAGGVVFVLAGPTLAIRSERNGKVLETNYDFLPKALLNGTLLSTSSSRTGSQYDPSKEWADYFRNAPVYYKTIRVQADDKGRPYISYYPGAPPYYAKVLPLALTKVTSQVVACIIAWGPGDVVILPPPENMYWSLLYLKDREAELYKENMESVGEDTGAPQWIQNYRSSDHRVLDEKLTSLASELQKVRQNLKPFQIASSCLYSTKRRLEIAVSRIFSDFRWNVEDFTKTGQPIDYVINGKNGKSLVVALTGTTGYIDSKSGKLAQLLGAFPEVGDKGRLVFLINGSTETDPAVRSVASYITDEALRRLTKNDVCVLRIFDLYRLWMNYLDKKTTADEIFQSIHGTCGLFEYTVI